MIQGHQMVLVETEGSHVTQITIDSLDLHVGQSFSVLVTANQAIGDYHMVASPTQVDPSNLKETIGISVLHYYGSTSPPLLPLPAGPNPMDQQFSVDQAKSIRCAHQHNNNEVLVKIFYLISYYVLNLYMESVNCMDNIVVAGGT